MVDLDSWPSQDCFRVRGSIAMMYEQFRKLPPDERSVGDNMMVDTHINLDYLISLLAIREVVSREDARGFAHFYLSRVRFPSDEYEPRAVMLEEIDTLAMDMVLFEHGLVKFKGRSVSDKGA